MAQIKEQEPRQETESKPAATQQLSYDAAPAVTDDNGKKRKLRMAVLALVVVAAIVAIPVYSYYSARESTDDAQVDGHLIPISFRISGSIQQVLVDDNQQVKKGQELVKLDPADYEVALAQAQAQLATAQATLAESGANVPLTNINTESQVDTSKSQALENQAAVSAAQQAANQARAQIAAAKATLDARQADYERAQKDLARFKDLVAKDEVSRQEYDAADAAAKAAAANVDAAKANLNAAQHSLDKALADQNQAKSRFDTAVLLQKQSVATRPQQRQMSEARYQEAQAQVQQREANLKQAQLNVTYTVLRAPEDGMVSRKSAEPGMQVTPGQEIMSIVPLSGVWITANFKETQLRKMHIGQRVEITVDTFGGGRKYRGHIDSIAATSGAVGSILPPENATGNYVKVVQRVPVKIVLEQGENSDQLLRPGMSVTPVVLLNN